MTSSLTSLDVFFIISLPVVGLEHSNLVTMFSVTWEFFFNFDVDDVIDDVTRCVFHYLIFIISAYGWSRILIFSQCVQYGMDIFSLILVLMTSSMTSSDVGLRNSNLVRMLSSKLYNNSIIFGVNDIIDDVIRYADVFFYIFVHDWPTILKSGQIVLLPTM